MVLFRIWSEMMTDDPTELSCLVVGFLWLVGLGVLYFIIAFLRTILDTEFLMFAKYIEKRKMCSVIHILMCIHF